MMSCKYGEEVAARRQDNPAFTNKRYSLVDCPDPVVDVFRTTFADERVKRAALARFYVDPTPDLVSGLSIHKEFEYTFTEAGRFQNIHVDIPPKFLSFVFYMPELEMTADEEKANATILYDRELRPHHGARCRRNSVCMFAPHFHSYHGFASTRDRDVLVMFYVNDEEHAHWKEIRRDNPETPPYLAVRDAVERKLLRFPLIEFGSDPQRIAAEREACLVNASLGRVTR